MILLFPRTCQQPAGMLVPAVMAGSMIQRTSTGQHDVNSLLPYTTRALQTGSQLINTRAQVNSEWFGLGLRGILDPCLLTGWTRNESESERRTSIFSPSSLSVQCLACSSLAGSGEKFEKKTVINPLFSATTTAGYRRFYPPTWLLLCPASQSPSSPNTSPSAFCGKFQLYPVWLQLRYGFLLLIILQLLVCDQ